MKIFILRILLVFSLIIGYGTAGIVWAEASSQTPPLNLKIEEWIWHDFTFLPLPADKQSTGYEIFAVDPATQTYQGDGSERIPYAEHVGKSVTVTEIVPFITGYNQQEYMVHMTVNDTGEELIGCSIRARLAGLVLTSDLNNARQQFLGKTVYPKFKQLSPVYVHGSMPQPISTTIGSPVTVVDVYTGNQSQKPISLLVSVNGQKAILPIAYSWTNIPSESWTQTPPWQDALLMEEPTIGLCGSCKLLYQIKTHSKN